MMMMMMMVMTVKRYIHVFCGGQLDLFLGASLMTVTELDDDDDDEDVDDDDDDDGDNDDDDDILVMMIAGIVGGQLGLFLGASLLTVTELMEHLLCLLWSSFSHLLGRARHKTADSTG